MVRNQQNPQHLKKDDVLFFDELNKEEKSRVQQHLGSCFFCAEKFRETVQIHASLLKMISLTHINNRLLSDYVIFKSGAATIGALTDEEINLVEKHLGKCPLCREEFKLLSKEYHSLDSHFEKFQIGSVARTSVVDKLLSLGKSIRNSFKFHLNPVKTGVAVLVFIALLILLQVLSLDNKYQELAEFHPPLFVPMALRHSDETDAAEARFADGISYYQNRQYEACIRQLKKVLAINPEHVYARFYLGICTLIRDETDEAIKHFEIAAHHKDNPLSEKIFWYTGKAYLKAENPVKAIEMFNRVVQLNGTYQQPAEEIIEKIQALNAE